MAFRLRAWDDDIADDSWNPAALFWVGLFGIVATGATIRVGGDNDWGIGHKDPAIRAAEDHSLAGRRRPPGLMSSCNSTFDLSPERWQLRATAGHSAYQRCLGCAISPASAGRRAHLSRTGNNCPGDDDLEQGLNAVQLAEALDSTLRIVQRCVDLGTLDSLAETLRLPNWGESRVHSRGSVIQRVLPTTKATSLS